LELLILKGNYIDDISPLINANFQNLKYLNLDYNYIGDINIQYFNKFNFQKLKELSIYSNNLNDFQFFKTITNYPKLDILNAGKNQFNKNINELINDNKSNINLIQLKEIELSNGVFSENNIKILSKFKFDNLKILYLNINNLYSLSFIKNLECSYLEEIQLNNNYIKEFMPLIKYKNLKKIDLGENKISNIDHLINFIKELKNLQKISIKYNLIDLNDIKNNKILNYIIKELKVKLLI